MNPQSTQSINILILFVIGASEVTFKLDDDEMELGLGIHGEAGVKKIKVLTQNVHLISMTLIVFICRLQQQKK